MWRLFAKLVMPPHATSAAIIVPPFGEESKLWRHTMKVLSDRLVATGIGCMRFDPSGCGESEGIGGADAWAVDLAACAYEVLKNLDAGSVFFIGIRAGAAISAMCAPAVPNAAQMWIDPVHDLREYFRNLGRRQALHRVICSEPSQEADAIHELEGCAVDVSSFDGRREHITAGARERRSAVSVLYSGRHHRGSDPVVEQTLQRGTAVNLNCDFGTDAADHALADAILCQIRTFDRGCQQHGPCDHVTRCLSAAAVRRVLSVETQYGHEVAIPGAHGQLRGFLLGREESEWTVIFLHGRAGYRVGPGRIFCHAGKAFRDLGFSSLRFDFGGWGDSDGIGVDRGVAIQERHVDALVDDASSAISMIRSGRPGTNIILCGICLGAYVELMLAAHSPGGIKALCLVSPYFMGVENEFGARARTAAELSWEYARKALMLGTWLRLAKGQLAFRRIARTFRDSLFAVAPAHASHASAETGQYDRIPCLLVLAQRDPYHVAVEKLIAREYGNRVHLDSVIIRGADHNFGSVGARQRAIHELTRFVTHLAAGELSAPSAEGGKPPLGA